jgi:hypothetical protein
MKLGVIIFGFFLLFSCSSPIECVEASGAATSKEVAVPVFNKIIVYRGISLVISQGDIQKVEVQTGDNLIDNIEVKVVDGLLSIKDNTSCNWVRDYGNTKVFVTAPNLIEIHSKTEKTITSNTFLTYPILRLFSMDLSDGAGTGDFNLKLNNFQTVIENNNVSRFYISGQTNELVLNFYEGNGRFSGENFLSNSVQVFHRGMNDLTVHPIEKISGKMVSTGNLILINKPPIVDVQQLYIGQIIYN